MECCGFRLIEGRRFDDRDGDGAPLVVLVNEAAARRHWPDGRPLGSRARLSGMPDFATVVGVVGDVRHEEPERSIADAY
jgi:putative ABC transport system permease protein